MLTKTRILRGLGICLSLLLIAAPGSSVQGQGLIDSDLTGDATTLSHQMFLPVIQQGSEATADVGAAAAAAATLCPPASFVNNLNLAKNPSFEIIGPKGSPVSSPKGNPNPGPSAAQDWVMHTSNTFAKVTSELLPTTVPGGQGGARMLHFIADGNEGGIYQLLPTTPAKQKLMFSVWVYVRRGHVAIQSSSGNQGPGAWSTKIGEWEQLRICTDGTVPTNMLVIYNQDPTGGDFSVDRVEVRQTP